MPLLNKIKVEKSLTANGPPLLEWNDDGQVNITIPVNDKRRKLFFKKPLISKNDYILVLKRGGSSNFILNLTHLKITLISINISVESIYKESEVITTISKINFDAELTIEAPQIIIKGSNKGPNLNFLSHNCIYIYENITCEDELTLKAAKNIQIFNEAKIQCKKLTSNCLKIYHYGAICNLRDDKILELDINADIFHLSMDGRIGTRHKKIVGEEENLTNVVKGSINASLRNFGKIKANLEISLMVKEILSLKTNQDDTAQRLYSSLMKSPTSTSLQSNLSKSDVTKNEKGIRGSIEARLVIITVELSLEDMAQIHGDHIILSVGDKCICMESSKCSTKTIEIKSCQIIDISGNLNVEKANIKTNGNIVVAKTGLICANEINISIGNFKTLAKNVGIKIRGSLKTTELHSDSSGYFNICKDGFLEAQNARITSNNFHNRGTLFSKLNLYLYANKFQQKDDAKMNVGRYFHLNATSNKKNWKGLVEANHIRIVPKNKIISHGITKCEIFEINLNHKKTVFCLKNSLNIGQTFLVKQTEDILNNENLAQIYNIKINGNLITPKIAAENSTIKLNSQGCVRIIESDMNEAQFHANQIYSCNGSIIILPVKKSNNILCNKTWFCKGNVIIADTISEEKALCNSENLVLNGSIKTEKLLIHAAREKNIEVYAIIQALEIKIQAEKNEIKICKESSLDCTKLSLIGDQASIEGEIFNYAFDNKLLLDFYVNKLLMNGGIGLRNNECVTAEINGEIKGDLLNHGIIESLDSMKIKVQNLLVSKMENENEKTPKICSNNLQFFINEICEDCNQFSGKSMEIDVKGNAYSCKDTIWVGGSVTLNVGENFIIDGTIMLDDANIAANESICTTASSDIKIKEATISSPKFKHDGKWNSENLNLEKMENINITGEIKLNHANYNFCGELLFDDNSKVNAEISKILNNVNDSQDGANIIFNGMYSTEILNVETNANVLIAENSVLTIDEGNLTLNKIENNGMINVGKNFNIVANNFHQNNSGKIIAEQNLKIEAKTISNDGLLEVKNHLIFASNNFENSRNGKILSTNLCEVYSEVINLDGILICEELFIYPKIRVDVIGNLETDYCKVLLEDSSVLFQIDGYLACKKSLMFLPNKDKQILSDLKTHSHLNVGGNISSQCIDANNTAIELKSKSRLFIHNNELEDANLYSILCEKIIINEGAVLAIETSENSPKIICNTEWIQHGLFIKSQNLNEIEVNLSNSKLLFQGSAKSPKIFISPASENMSVVIEGEMDADEIEILTENGNVYTFQNSSMQCDMLKIKTPMMFNFGVICSKDKTDLLKIDLNVNEVVNGNTGNIEGQNNILLNITGDLLNYGKIQANSNIEMCIQNILSISKNPLPKIDSMDQKLLDVHYSNKSEKPMMKAKKLKIVAEKAIEDCSQICGNLIEISAKRNVICEENSIWKTSKIILSTEGKFLIEGKIEMDAAKIIANSINTSSHGCVEIGEISLKVIEFECAGTWKCQDFKLQNSKNDEIFSFDEIYNPKFDRGYFEKFHNKSFKIEGTGKLCFQNATIFTQLFQNMGLLEVENELTIFAYILRQENGTISGSQKAEICVTEAPMFSGSLLSKNLKIAIYETFLCSAVIEAEQAEIILFDSKTSLFELNNEMFVKGPLTIKTINDSATDTNNLSDEEMQNGFVIKESLIADSINSEALIQLEENGKIHLEKNNQKISTKSAKKVLLDIASINVKQNAIIKAINYQQTLVRINVANIIMFDGILDSTHEIDCLPYIDKERVNECISFTEFLACLHVA